MFFMEIINMKVIFVFNRTNQLKRRLPPLTYMGLLIPQQNEFSQRLATNKKLIGIVVKKRQHVTGKI